MNSSRFLPSRPVLRSLLNGVMFQTVWVACVAGGGAGLWWLGPILVLAFAAWQIPRSASPTGEVALVVVAAGMGLIIDTLFIRLNLLTYPEHGPLEFMAPLWIIALWAGFALTLNHSLAWLRGRPLLAALLGGVSGPFSYWIGATTWRAVDFVAAPALVLAVLAIVWAIATPMLLGLGLRFSEAATPRRNSENQARQTPILHLKP